MKRKIKYIAKIFLFLLFSAASVLNLLNTVLAAFFLFYPPFRWSELNNMFAFSLASIIYGFASLFVYYYITEDRK